MCGGGSTGMSGIQPASYASVSPNPQAMQWATSAYDKAAAAANTPYQAWGTTPDAYVAQLTPLQYAGFEQLGQASQAAQPWYQSAGQMAGQGQQMLGAASSMYPAAQQSLQMGQNLYGQGAGMINAAQGYYGQGAGMVGQGANYYGQGAATLSQVPQFYNQGAGLIGQGADYYNQGANIAGMAPGMYQAGAGMIGQGTDYYGQGANLINQGTGYYGLGSGLLSKGAGMFDQGAALAGQGAGYYGQGASMLGQGAGMAQQAAAQRVADQSVAAISDPYYQRAAAGTQAAMTSPGGLAAASPYLTGGAGMLGSAGQMTTPVGQEQIQSFMSPYMKQVTDPTMAYLKQQQEQAMSGQTGNAIKSGAFGGDRAGLVAAQLAGQQQLAQGQTLGNLLQQGYGQALGAAFQQQGATQADLARQAQVGQAMGQLGQTAGSLQTSDLGRMLQGAGQLGQLGTAQRGAYEQQQSMQQADLARQLQAAQAVGQMGIGTGQMGAGLGNLGSTINQAAAGTGQLGVGMGQMGAGLVGAGQGLGQMGSGMVGAGQGMGQLGTGLTGTGQAFGQFGQGMGQLGTGMGQLGAGMTGVAQGWGQMGTGMTNAGQTMGQLGTGMVGAGQGMGQMGAGFTNIGGQYGNLATGMGNIGAQYGSLANIMGNLGTGAQNAMQQGAQGLIGAGTLQQQTNQAGIDALINNFNQWRATPYQQAQFLANITGALGPLMGTTQYGGQAFPMQPYFSGWSDPRLKTGVGAAFADGGDVGGDADGSKPEVVGQLFDGQPVHRYRLTDPQTGQLGAPQIGLMSTEVAQSHPEALGSAAGFDTVDYAKATDDAARLGGAVTNGGDYADGGAVPGLQDLIARQKAMYAGGLGGAQQQLGAGIPGGGNPQIPMGNITAGQLQKPSFTPMQPKEQKSTGIGDIAKFASKGIDLYKTYKDPKSDALDLAKGVSGMFAKGGFIDEDTGIPLNPIQANPLIKPDLPKQKEEKEDDKGGFLDTVLGLGKLAVKAAPMVMSLSDPKLKTGVRNGYATDGAVDEDSDYLARTMLREAGGEGPEGMRAVGDVILNRLESGKYGPDIRSVVTAPKQFSPWNPEARGTRADPRTIDPASEQYQTALGMANALRSGEGRGLTQGAMNFANINTVRSERGDKGLQPWISEALKQPTLNIGHHTFMNLGKPGEGSVDTSKLGERERSFEAKALNEPAPEGLGAASAPARKGFLENIQEHPEDLIIPALQGIGAMAQSRSLNPFGAIMEGLGAGASGYAGRQQQLVEQALLARKADIESARLPLESRRVSVDEAKQRFEEEEAKRRREASQKAYEIATGATSQPPVAAPAPAAAPAVAQPAPLQSAASTSASEAQAAQHVARADQLRKASLVEQDPAERQRLFDSAEREDRMAQEIRDRSPEKKTEDLEAAGFGKDYLETQDQAEKSIANLENIKRARELLEEKGFYTGPGGEKLSQALSAMSIVPVVGEYTKGAASAAQQFNAITKQMLLDSSGGSLGAGISNEDRKVIGSTKPSLETTYDANKELLYRAEKLEERKQKIAEFQRQWKEANPNMPLNKYKKDLNEWAKQNPIFSDKEREAAGAYGKGKAAPLPASKNLLVVGQTYRTAKGDLIWNGRGFSEK